MMENGKGRYYIGDSCYFVTIPSCACGYELHIDRGLNKFGQPYNEFLGHWGTMTGFLKGFERYVVKHNEIKGKTGRMTLEDLIKEQVKAIEYVNNIAPQLKEALNGR